ncbi:deAMPylase SidD family protein [Legionella rowbothamii]|uniref:deAMPylase SidD family protein n=1 Tax=Legionella rowbothamii TaxID=96229 RepID=UPI001056C228|nr:deAMPylase SidD family protein [Legionella rowbothamii]
MRGLITQVCNGVLHEEVYRSRPNALDHGNSEVLASSLFIHFDEEGKSIAKPKNSDDKLVIGYTQEGMAFQIIVDGFYGGERQATFAFIDNHVVSLMERYSTELSTASAEKTPQDITEQLIHTIYSLRLRHAINSEFTMSLSMMYQKEDAFYCAGFGIGDTGIAIKRIDGTIEQLTYHTEVDGSKDAFDNYSSPHVDLVIQRNSIFNTPVTPGDELVGYTYLPQELEIIEREFKVEETTKRGEKLQKEVQQRRLAPHHFNNQGSLFTQLLDVVDTTQQQLIKQAKQSGEYHRFGDDFSVARLVIPDANLIKQLQAKATLHALQLGLTAYLAQENKGLLGLLDIFTGTAQCRQRASRYQSLLAKYQDNDLICVLIFLALASNDKEKPIQKYLTPYLELPSGITLEAKLRDSLKRLDCPAANVKELMEQIRTYINAPKQGNVDLLSTFEQQDNFSLSQIGS